MRSLTTDLHRRIDELVQDAIRRDDQPLPSMAEIARSVGCDWRTVALVVDSDYTDLRRTRGAELRPPYPLYLCVRETKVAARSAVYPL